MSTSVPVSPITESGDRPSVEWPGPRPSSEETEEEARQSIQTSPSIPVPHDSKKKQEISLDLRDISADLPTISDSLKSTTATTEVMEQLLPPQPGEPRPLSIWDQLGRWNLVILGVGSIYSLLIIGFLWFVWGGHEDIPFWRWLVLQNYVQRTVTFSSAALRVIMAIQSSLATSMLAAIIMETLGFTLKRSVVLSSWRSNAGLVLPFSLLEFRYFLRHARVLSSLIILLSFTTLAAYLTSTALIADFEVVPIAGYANANQLSYTVSNKTILGDEPTYSSYRPANFPIFAEYSEPTDKSDPEIDDTGPVVRGILPISSPTVRENLNSYSGIGTLLNSHVICVKPMVHSLTFESVNKSSLLNDGLKPLLSGSISLGKVPSGITNNTDIDDFFSQMPQFERGMIQPVTFVCQLAESSQMIAGEWPISMCVAGNRLDYNNSYLDPGRIPILGTRATSLLNGDLLVDPLSYIVVNYSGIPPKSYVIGPGKNLTVISINDTSWTEVEDVTWPTWVSIKAPSRFPNFESVSISYCFSHFAGIDAPLTANCSSPNSEPTLSSSLNQSTLLDASNVTRQLGADGLQRTLQDRGILALQKPGDWSIYTSNYVGEPGILTTTALDGSYGFGMQRNHFTSPAYMGQEFGLYVTHYMGSPVSATWGLCTNCMVGTTDDNTFGIHSALSSVFQHSIKSSKSVATALQALLTVVNMMQYYDRLPLFDLQSKPEISLFEPAVQPRHRMGLTFVTIGLLIHLCAITTITIMFHLRTKSSFIGQSWHTVAQLQNENAIPVLERAGMMRDKDVEKWMKAEGIDPEERFFMTREMARVEDPTNDRNLGSLRRRCSTSETCESRMRMSIA